MREIKFRAWRENKMHYNITTAHYEHNAMSGSGGDLWDFAEWMKWSKVMQYTGLKDKNGKDVYEGDIVKFHPWNSPKKELEDYLCNTPKQIKWGLDNGQYPSVGFVAINLRPSDLEDGHQLNSMDARNMEVIGNIFESKK